MCGLQILVVYLGECLNEFSHESIVGARHLQFLVFMTERLKPSATVLRQALFRIYVFTFVAIE